MIRTIHALVLVGGLLGLVGQGFAQDPVTERPGQPEPMPAKKLAPAPARKPLVTFEGREEWGTTGTLTFHIYQSGKVRMIDATRKPVEGTVKIEGNRLQLIFGNCVYDGTEKNGVLTGKASYTDGADAGKTWNFRVSVRNRLIGRNFAGQETLKDYGPVSFRFINATTVEMTDVTGVHRGTYVQNGLQVAMTFGATIYTGEIRGNSIAGAAHDTRSNWTFQVDASK